MENLLVKN